MVEPWPLASRRRLRLACIESTLPMEKGRPRFQEAWVPPAPGPCAVPLRASRLRRSMLGSAVASMAFVALFPSPHPATDGVAPSCPAAGQPP